MSTLDRGFFRKIFHHAEGAAPPDLLQGFNDLQHIPVLKVDAGALRQALPGIAHLAVEDIAGRAVSKLIGNVSLVHTLAVDP